MKRKRSVSIFLNIDAKSLEHSKYQYYVMCAIANVYALSMNLCIHRLSMFMNSFFKKCFRPISEEINKKWLGWGAE